MEKNLLTREQAIMIIDQYITKKGTFVFDFSFPFSAIPKDFEIENWLFRSALDIRQDELSFDVQNIVYSHLLSSKIIARKRNYIEFKNKDHIISLNDYIKYLENYQKQFDDMQDREDVELNDQINIINKIKKYEYKLIDEAEILLKIKEDIERCVLQWRKKVSDKNYWKGE